MSKTSLAQRNNEARLKNSNISIGNYSMGNALSSRKLQPPQFPIDLQLNLVQQLNTLHILQKYQQYFSNGRGEKQIYRGQQISGRKQGFGSFIFKNNDQYIGYWDNDTMNGMGVYRYNSVQIGKKYAYIGQFFQGKFHGIGKLVLLISEKEGQIIYQGYWIKGQKSGHGIHFYNRDVNQYYDGYWEANAKNGQGRLFFKNGQFSGHWNNDKRQGQGRLRVQQERQILIYEGDWKNDELVNGQITYMTLDSTRVGSYVGDIRNGKKHGKGTFEFKNHKLTGLFQDDHFLGQGVLQSQNYILRGNFLQNSKNVQGQIKYSNGDIFEGIIDISNGLIKRKKGTYKYKNGDQAKGHFDDKGGGVLIGLFQYIWNTGDKKKFDS